MRAICRAAHHHCTEDTREGGILYAACGAIHQQALAISWRLLDYSCNAY